MTRTLLAELERAVRRRITLVLVAVALGLTVVIGAFSLILTDDLSETEHRTGAQRVELIEGCVHDPFRWGERLGADIDERVDEDERRARCADEVDSWYEVDQGFLLRELWDPDREEGFLLLPATLLMLCGLGAGASMVGAEWKAGTVSTLLCWEPRRAQLLGARMLASFLAAGAIAVVLQLLFSSAFVPTALLKGSTEGMTEAWWREYVFAVLRIGLLTGGAATLGVALGSITRSSAGGMASVMLWIAVGEPIVSALEPRHVDLLIAPNLAVLLMSEGIEDGLVVISVADAAVRLAGYLAITIVVALALFNRRDVAN